MYRYESRTESYRACEVHNVKAGQGFTDEQFNKVAATGMSDAQLYKQAGNAVTTNVIEALARFILEIDKENANE